MSMSKFKIGDVVRIGVVEGSPGAVSEMNQYFGKNGTICSTWSNHYHGMLYDVQIIGDGSASHWFHESVLSLDNADLNKSFIEAFLFDAKEIEYAEDGIWFPIKFVNRRLSKLPMRFKNDERYALEKSIEKDKKEIEEIQNKIGELMIAKKHLRGNVTSATKKLEKII